MSGASIRGDRNPFLGQEMVTRFVVALHFQLEMLDILIRFFYFIFYWTFLSMELFSSSCYFFNATRTICYLLHSSKSFVHNQSSQSVQTTN